MRQFLKSEKIMAMKPRSHGQQRGRRSPPNRSARSRENAKMYTRMWSRWSKAHLRANPLCVACEKMGRVTMAKHVDHITPHDGDWGLFSDHRNWQGLCIGCHGRKTAKEGSNGNH